MNIKFVHHGLWIVVSFLTLSLNISVSAQPYPFPGLGPPHRPLIKLIGFLDPDVPPTVTHPILTLAFPGQEQRHTFLLTDMRIMAGPLRTPGDILDEVRPYSTNFYIRAPQNIVAQITSATPAEQLILLAEYVSADRSLMIKGVEKNEEPRRQ